MVSAEDILEAEFLRCLNKIHSAFLTNEQWELRESQARLKYEMWLKENLGANWQDKFCLLNHAKDYYLIEIPIWFTDYAGLVRLLKRCFKLKLDLEKDFLREKLRALINVDPKTSPFWTVTAGIPHIVSKRFEQFLDDVLDAFQKSISNVRSEQAISKKRKEKQLKPRENKLYDALKNADEMKLKGKRRFTYLENQRVKPRQEWIDDGCPASYSEMYKDTHWRQKAYDEWHKLKLKVNARAAQSTA